MSQLGLSQNPAIHLAGDEDSGFATTINLQSGAVGQMVLVYTGKYAHPHAEREVRCEIYEAAGVLSVHSCCVRCGDVHMIDGAKKRIEYDRAKNLLFIERFGCNGELEKGARRAFGINRCNAWFAYDGRVVKDA